MKPDGPDEDLLASVADGIPVDWNSALREGEPEAHPRLEALRVISSIADFNRGLQRGTEDAEFPERWGDLLLLERLGGGAGADVFRAWDASLRREVALKLLRPDARAGSHRDDDTALLAEGRAVAAIRHPHVVTVYGIERHDGRVGLSMELLRGTTLEREVLARGALDLDTTRRLGVEIGSALDAVHVAGLIHRDIKPANVMRDTEGRFVLADFGLGLRAGDAERAAVTSGTPMYMAPETLAGSPASARSDVYSLGLLLWFALAGRHPFDVATLAERVAAGAKGPTPSLLVLRPEIPQAFTDTIEKALAFDPQDRFANARELVSQLERLSAPGSTSGNRPSAIARVLVLAAIAVTLVSAFALWRARQPASSVKVATPPIASTASVHYAVEASFLRHDAGDVERLMTGDRVRPGDRLSLELRATRPVWVYVLNEDERGEQFLLFPQPRFDSSNPLAADSTVLLPGTIDGRANAWTVTSAGGREHFVVVASPEPVTELEADLARLPAPRQGAPVTYATIGPAVRERLRGVGGIAELPEEATTPVPRSSIFSRFRALAGRETDVQGIWVRQVVLENPR